MIKSPVFGFVITQHATIRSHGGLMRALTTHRSMAAGLMMPAVATNINNERRAIALIDLPCAGPRVTDNRLLFQCIYPRFLLAFVNTSGHHVSRGSSSGQSLS